MWSSILGELVELKRAALLNSLTTLHNSNISITRSKRVGMAGVPACESNNDYYGECSDDRCKIKYSTEPAKCPEC